MTTLQITPELQVNSLIELRNADFAECYRLGLLWRIFGWSVTGMNCEPGPVSDRDLIEIFKWCARHGYFDEPPAQPLHHLGFVFGMIHGGVLAADGELHADATELVSIHDPYLAQGYASGRNWFCTGADDYCPLAHDEEVLELLVSIAEDNAPLDEAEEDLSFVLGSLLGDLSCHLFPLCITDLQAAS